MTPRRNGRLAVVKQYVGARAQPTSKGEELNGVECGYNDFASRSLARICQSQVGHILLEEHDCMIRGGRRAGLEGPNATG